MNEAVKLQLSALVDAELGPDEARFLLRRIEGEPDLAALWTRYHIAGECLRRQAFAPVSDGFSARLMQALPRAPSRQPRWLRMGVGGAIAASVAVAALVLVRPPTPSTQQPAGDSAPLAATVPAANDGGFAAAATNNYSLLLRDPNAPRLDVEPASAVVSPGYFALQPVGYVRQRPSWMQNTRYARPHTGIFTGMSVEAHAPAGASSVTMPQARIPATR